MLELINISRSLPQGKKESLSLLEQVSFAVPAGHLMVINGAPGSGKTALLNILAGLAKPTGGSILFQGKDCVETPLSPNVIGYVPAADDTLNDGLTVRESVMSALLLRVAGQTKDERVGKASHLLVGVGLETVASQRVSTLALAQRRRLKLALALVSDPAIVLCDEFTGGLDVRAEAELAALLKFVAADHPARVVIHATRALGNLSAYDTTVILHEGRVCFHGPSRAVTHYFSIQSIEELYPRLAKRPAQRWGDSWSRHRDSYYDAFKLGTAGETLAAPTEDEDGSTTQGGSAPKKEPLTNSATAAAIAPPARPLPSLMAQAQHLAQRRWTTFRRDRHEWSTQLALFLAAPLVSTLLVLPNMHYIQDLAADASKTPDPYVLWPAAFTCAMAVFVEVILVLMLSVRNGAREIARERPVFERERVGGVRSGAYLISKLFFILPIILLQCLTLGLFLETVTGGLPGFSPSRVVLLALTGVAFSTLCLGISAHHRNAERAHGFAWGLAFVNVVSAGALLGFPRVLGGMLQPFVTAYYGWSGSMETLQDTLVFHPITLLVRTWFATPKLAMLALVVHFIVGITLAMTGLRKRR